MNIGNIIQFPDIFWTDIHVLKYRVMVIGDVTQRDKNAMNYHVTCESNSLLIQFYLQGTFTVNSSTSNI